MHGCCCCLRRCLGNWFPVLAELGEGRPFSLKPGCPSLFSVLQRKGQAGSWCCRGGVKARGGGPAAPSSPPATPTLQGDPRQPQTPACPAGAAGCSRWMSQRLLLGPKAQIPKGLLKMTTSPNHQAAFGRIILGLKEALALRLLSA